MSRFRIEAPGWEPDRRSRAAAEAPLGAHLLFEDSIVTEGPGWYQVLTPSSSNPSLNEVYVSQTEGAETDAVVRETLAQYERHQRSLKWCVGPWTRPRDLGDRLRRLEFERWGARGMTCASKLSIPAPGKVAVERVTAAKLDEYVATFIEGWSLPAAEATLLRAAHARGLPEERARRYGARSRPPRAFFLARVGAEAAGAAAVVLQPESAYLVGAVVLPPHRGRGVYRALLAARLDLARRRGLPLATTHAREETSAPILERLGFATAFSYDVLLRPAASSASSSSLPGPTGPARTSSRPGRS